MLITLFYKMMIGIV